MSHTSDEVTPERHGWRRPLTAFLLVAGIATVVVLVWFQPQRLLIDDRVNDAAPESARSDGRATATSNSADANASSPPAAAGSNEVAKGSFVSLDHATTGRALVLDLGEDRQLVRFEDFETDNGPDLFVYLTSNPSDGDEGAFDDDFVNLGRLKGNIGNQNYEVPAGADLARYTTVVIWCDRFNSAFGAADLGGR